MGFISAEAIRRKSMRNIRLTVEYDGADFCGFQRQPGRRSVQGVLEWALSRVTKESIKIAGAGRTDAGVHALGQVVTFKTGGSVPTEKIPVAVNSLVARDVVVNESREVADDFHARFSAKARVYQYKILRTEYPSAFDGRYVWWYPYHLDLDRIREAAGYLVGHRDFASFAMAKTDVPSTVRNLIRLEVEEDKRFVVIHLEANAFLHSMARIIVGTLVEVGQGRRRAEEMHDILEARDRRAAGITAPPQGLCLIEVKY